MDVYSFWNDTLAQDAVKIRKYFHEDAYINWHDTNEHFILEEFIIANCEYPDKWNGIWKFSNYSDTCLCNK